MTLNGESVTSTIQSMNFVTHGDGACSLVSKFETNLTYEARINVDFQAFFFFLQNAPWPPNIINYSREHSSCLTNLAVQCKTTMLASTYLSKKTLTRLLKYINSNIAVKYLS